MRGFNFFWLGDTSKISDEMDKEDSADKMFDPTPGPIKAHKSKAASALCA